MNTYTVAPGAEFVMPDGERKGAGASIELPADVAAMHADKLEPLDPPVQTPAQLSDLDVQEPA